MFTLLIPFRDNTPITAFHGTFHCCYMSVDHQLSSQRKWPKMEICGIQRCYETPIRLLSLDKALSSVKTAHIVCVFVCDFITHSNLYLSCVCVSTHLHVLKFTPGGLCLCPGVHGVLNVVMFGVFFVCVCASSWMQRRVC